MKETIDDQLTAFNQIAKELDDIYHNYALSVGMSDSALWLLYSIWVYEETYTQRELCAEWSFSPQTINSALKGLEKQGLVELILAPGSKRNKQIHLTDSGKELAKKTVDPLINAERNAFGGLSEEERRLMLGLTRKHVAILKEETAKMNHNGTPSADR